MKSSDMLQDIAQTRSLENFVTNHNDMVALNKKLKLLFDEEITVADFDL